MANKEQLTQKEILDQVGRVHSRASNLIQFLTARVVDGTHPVGAGEQPPMTGMFPGAGPDGIRRGPDEDVPPQPVTFFIGRLAVANFDADERDECEELVNEVNKALDKVRDSIMKDASTKLKAHLK